MDNASNITAVCCFSWCNLWCVLQYFCRYTLLTLL